MLNYTVKKPLLIFTGLFAGLISYIAPGTIVIFLLALISISIIMSRCADEEEKRFIFLIFAAGFLSRIIICSLLHLFSMMNNIGYKNDALGLIIPDLFGDSGSYSLRGWLTSQYLHNKLSNAGWFNNLGWLFCEDTETSYNFVVYTLFYYFFGFAQLSAKFINSLFGTLSAVLVYFITKDVVNRTAAKVASFLTMFFPSMFLWSLTNLKEPPTTLLLCLAVFASIKFNRQHKLRHLSLIFIIVYLIKAMRPVLFLPFLAGALMSLLFMKKGLIRIIVIILVLSVLLVNPLGYRILNFGKNVIVETFKKFIDLQQGYFLTGGSVYKIYGEGLYNCPAENIKPITLFKYMPKSWVYFLFTPFPWGVHTALQIISYPQIILWYILAFFAILGIFSIDKKVRVDAFIILLYAFFITSAFALASGNIGTALRHRDVVLPLFFIFSAAGLTRVFKNRI